jgi:hypothetical protein
MFRYILGDAALLSGATISELKAVVFFKDELAKLDKTNCANLW